MMMCWSFLQTSLGGRSGSITMIRIMPFLLSCLLFISSCSGLGLAPSSSLVSYVGTSKSYDNQQDDVLDKWVENQRPRVVIEHPIDGRSYNPTQIHNVPVTVNALNFNLFPPSYPAWNISSGPFLCIELLQVAVRSILQHENCLDTEQQDVYQHIAGLGPQMLLFPNSWWIFRAYFSLQKRIPSSGDRSGYASATIKHSVKFQILTEDKYMPYWPEGSPPDDSPLAQHLASTLERSYKLESRLDIAGPVMDMKGMSGTMSRIFLNHLLNYPDASYLEIGLYQGSTFCAALAHNQLMRAVGIDNWVEFGGPRNEFWENLEACHQSSPTPTENIQIYEADMLAVALDLSRLETQAPPFNFYFFDGPHEFRDQYVALTYFYPFLADEAVVVIDDYNHMKVEAGTEAALADMASTMGVEVIYKAGVYTSMNGQGEWHNGVMAFVLRRKQKSMLVIKDQLGQTEKVKAPM